MSKLSLRERKFARTKLQLLEAAVAALEKARLDEIPVRQLCEACDVSEATFFNYFEGKDDLLVYYAQLWWLELGFVLQDAADQAPLQRIASVFRAAAEKAQHQPGVTGELLAHQARLRQRPRHHDLGLAELRRAFPERSELDTVPDTSLEILLRHTVEEAVRGDELPGNTHVGSVLGALFSIFYGVPTVYRHLNPRAIASAYAQQLNYLWQGVRSAAQPLHRANADQPPAG